MSEHDEQIRDEENPMRITVHSTVEELDDATLCDLTDEEVQRLIDLECSREGVPLLPADPGPSPVEPKVENDVRTYEVSLGYRSVAELQDRMAATKLAEAISGVTTIDTSYRKGRSVVTGTSQPEVKVDVKERLSESVYEAHRVELERYQTARDEWEEMNRAWKAARRDREEVVDRIQGAITEAWNRRREREKAIDLWERYLVLADGEVQTARRFLKDADARAYEILDELDAFDVPDEPDEPVEEPVEEVAN